MGKKRITDNLEKVADEILTLVDNDSSNVKPAFVTLQETYFNASAKTFRSLWNITTGWGKAPRYRQIEAAESEIQTAASGFVRKQLLAGFLAEGGMETTSANFYLIKTLLKHLPPYYEPEKDNVLSAVLPRLCTLIRKQVDKLVEERKKEYGQHYGCLTEVVAEDKCIHAKIEKIDLIEASNTKDESLSLRSNASKYVFIIDTQKSPWQIDWISPAGKKRRVALDVGPNLLRQYNTLKDLKSDGRENLLLLLADWLHRKNSTKLVLQLNQQTQPTENYFSLSMHPIRLQWIDALGKSVNLPTASKDYPELSAYLRKRPDLNLPECRKDLQSLLEKELSPPPAVKLIHETPSTYPPESFILHTKTIALQWADRDGNPLQINTEDYPNLEKFLEETEDYAQLANLNQLRLLLTDVKKNLAHDKASTEHAAVKVKFQFQGNAFYTSQYYSLCLDPLELSWFDALGQKMDLPVSDYPALEALLKNKPNFSEPETMESLRFYLSDIDTRHAINHDTKSHVEKIAFGDNVPLFVYDSIAKIDADKQKAGVYFLIKGDEGWLLHRQNIKDLQICSGPGWEKLQEEMKAHNDTGFTESQITNIKNRIRTIRHDFEDFRYPCVIRRQWDTENVSNVERNSIVLVPEEKQWAVYYVFSDYSSTKIPNKNLPEQAKKLLAEWDTGNKWDEENLLKFRREVSRLKRPEKEMNKLDLEQFQKIAKMLRGESAMDNRPQIEVGKLDMENFRNIEAIISEKHQTKLDQEQQNEAMLSKDSATPSGPQKKVGKLVMGDYSNITAIFAKQPPAEDKPAKNKTRRKPLLDNVELHSSGEFGRNSTVSEAEERRPIDTTQYGAITKLFEKRAKQQEKKAAEPPVSATTISI